MNAGRLIAGLVSCFLLPSGVMGYQMPESVPAVPDGSSNNNAQAETLIQPELDNSPPAAGRPQVQPEYSLPSEASPQPQPGMTIQAEQFRQPPAGLAEFDPRTGSVPDAFCSTDLPQDIPTASGSGGPRCSHGAADDRAPASGTFSDDLRTSDVEAGGSGASSGTLTAVFADAAHFATGACGPGDSCDGMPPVMIYEGMSVQVHADGSYEVRGIVEGPRVSTVLRLQLSFFAQNRKVATVTLPPIRLNPDSDGARLANETQNWFIRRTGYSDGLRQWPHSHAGLSVTRNGIAEVGQIPEP
ncbi:MAG: hypothetical protein RIK87_30695 [Fuerstiella sp.]